MHSRPVNGANMLICACVSNGAFAGLATELAFKHTEGKHPQTLLIGRGLKADYPLLS